MAAKHKIIKDAPPAKSFEDFKITSGPEKMTKEERNRLLSLNIRKEINKVAMFLEDFHGLFYQLWEMGYPRLTFSVPTAAVGFNKSGNQVDFMFNPMTWEKLDSYTRSFVISHECLHVMLNHGIRTKDCHLASLANIALDIVVNHMLVSKFGFNRASLDFSPLTEGHLDDKGNPIPHKNAKGEDIVLCWIDTVFKDQASNVSRNKPFEYYYHLLEQNVKIIEVAGDVIMVICDMNGNSGKGAQGEGEDNEAEKGQELGGHVLDDHSRLEEFGEGNVQDAIADHLNKSLGDDEKEDLNKRLCKTEEGNAADRSATDGNKGGNKPGGKQAGSIAGKIVYDPEARNVQKKRKWATVIKKWARKHIKDEANAEQWARQNRRISSISMKGLMLPSEASESAKEEEKIDVFFYQDASGSCIHLVERFFRAALSLPKDRFNVKGFSFDTQVHNVDFKNPEIRGGGGTAFDILESHIQHEVKTGNISKYPDAVFVVTDGMGNDINPEKPEKWYWFLAGRWTSKNNIPNNSEIFDLDDFE